MKIAGFGLLVSGWVLAVLALMLLARPVERGAFVAMGLVVEAVGLIVAGRAHREFPGETA